MKIILFITSFFFSVALWGQSQSHEFTIDYTVKYLINNKKKGAKDTISIGFEKNGKYLWSNYKGLAEEFAGEIMPGLGSIPEGASNFIYASEINKLYMAIYLGPLNLTMDMDIALALQGSFDDNDQINDNMVLESEKILSTFILNGKEYPKYEVYADIEPNSALTFAVDESKEMNNTSLFMNFIGLMMSTTQSSGNIEGEMPNGIILSIIDDKGNTALEAINVDTTPRKISINNSFKISE